MVILAVSGGGSKRIVRFKTDMGSIFDGEIRRLHMIEQFE